jgi:photosystem II stability/assembly factor-like uncharacterized protein
MDATAILSPNGQQTTSGAGPALRLLVGTLRGVVGLERQAPDAPWAQRSQALPDRHVSALVLEPGSGKLFAGAHRDGGVWVSDDGAGTSWRRASNGLERSDVYSLACRRRGQDVTLFAGVEPAALYRSDDLGQSWRELPALRNVPGTDKWTFPAPPHIAHVKCITIDPHRPTTLYTCVEQGALLKSEDDGESWVELDGYVLDDDATYHDAHRLEFHPSRDVLYLTTGLGLNSSEDGGKTWRPLTRRGARLGYPDFVTFDPRDAGTVFMAGAAAPPTAWLKKRVADPAVLKSTDGGQSWRELKNGLPDPIIGSIEAMSRHDWNGGSMLAFATATGEVYTSDDAGEHWTLVAEGLAPVSKAGHYRAFLPLGENPRQGAAAFA